MPMQAIQGITVQVGSPKIGNDSVKSDPADFLNVLAALLLPNTQPLPAVNPELGQNAEEEASSGLSMVMGPAVQGLQTVAVDLLAAKGAEVVPKVESLGAEEPSGLTGIQITAVNSQEQQALSQTVTPEMAPLQQDLQSTKGKDNIQASEAPVLAAESQLEAAEKKEQAPQVVSQSEHTMETKSTIQAPAVENGLAPQVKNMTASAESLSFDQVALGTQETVQAVGSKTESGQAGQDKEMDLKEELPATESSSNTQEIRTFADYLPKDIVSGQESKTIPGAGYKVPSQELAQEFPRIIESQLKNAEGKEISRDIIIHLEPKELGKLTVKLTSQEGVINVKILTEHLETRSLVESGLTNLRQSFSEQGIKYGRMEVELGGQSLYQHQQQPQHQQQQHQAPMYWSKQGTAQGSQWQEVSYYPEDSNVSAGSRLKPSGAVDYRV